MYKLAILSYNAEINNLAAEMDHAGNVPLTEKFGSFSEVVMEEEVVGSARVKDRCSHR